MTDEAAEFWAKFETETGEKVAERCLGQYFPDTGRDEGLWGLLVLTDKSFRFRETPSDNLIFGLVKRPRKDKEAHVPFDLAIPLGEIASIKSPKRGLLSRIFGSSVVNFSVLAKGESAKGESAKGEGERAYCFEADLRSGFISAIEKALAGIASS